MTSGSWRIGVFLCLFGCGHGAGSVSSPDPPEVRAKYAVTVLDGFRGARVRVCVEGGSVRELVPIRPSAIDGLRGAWLHGDAKDIAEGRIRLRKSMGASCVEYETAFERMWPRRSNSEAIVISQAQWLWRPEPFPSNLEASVHFVLPDGGRVSCPWPSADGVYSLSESAFFTEAYTVFGTFDSLHLRIAETSIDIVRLGHDPTDDAVERWLDRSVRTAASIGPFPRDRIHVVIAAVDAARDDVVFGMLRRGGGTSILLVPSSNVTRQGLDDDWVAVHELSHLWLPRFYPEDRWLSEGIATYLQEVLRARCGLQTEERAWERLLEGFERGRRSGTGRSLAIESRDMDGTGAWHRVYWAGAAFALEADIRLRKLSGGTETLLDALPRAQRVWGGSARPVRRSSFLQVLGEVSGTGFAPELAQQYQATSEFPDTSYLHSPELRRWRAQIMKPSEHVCGLSDEPSR